MIVLSERRYSELVESFGGTAKGRDALLDLERECARVAAAVSEKPPAVRRKFVVPAGTLREARERSHALGAPPQPTGRLHVVDEPRYLTLEKSVIAIRPEQANGVCLRTGVVVIHAIA
jgi:hypothetical protein